MHRILINTFSSNYHHKHTTTRPKKFGWLLLSESFLDLSPLAWYCVWLQGGDEMKNIIEELWNGEINPQDTLVDNNPHYKELQHLQSRNKTELLESLSEDQKEKLEKYCDTTLEMNSVSEREAFASGFRIALRLACAALADQTNE
jgi:hypothetical protein